MTGPMNVHFVQSGHRLASLGELAHMIVSEWRDSVLATPLRLHAHATPMSEPSDQHDQPANPRIDSANDFDTRTSPLYSLSNASISLRRRLSIADLALYTWLVFMLRMTPTSSTRLFSITSSWKAWKV